MSIPCLLRQNLAERFGLMISGHPGFAGTREQLDQVAAVLAETAIAMVDANRPAPPAANPDGKACATCRNWVRGRRGHFVHTSEGLQPVQWLETQLNGEALPHGECRASSPVPNSFPPFAITRPDDWCALHSRRYPGEVSAEQIADPAAWGQS